MSLFSDLPPPTAKVLDSNEDAHVTLPAEAAVDAEQPPAKRAKLDIVVNPEDHNPGTSQPALSTSEAEHPEPTPEQHQPGPSVEDTPEQQVVAALRKIRAHISNQKKFPKAAGLLKQLLDGGSITSFVRHECFETIRAAFMDLNLVSEPMLRREYRRLMRSIEERAEVFTKSERTHLEIYTIYAHLLNDLFTDDSFMFSKTVNKIKEMITSLPDAEPEDSTVLDRAIAKSTDFPEQPPPEPEPEPSAPEPAPPSDPEADPFGLDALLEVKSKASKVNTKVNAKSTTAWSNSEAMCMRRQALVDCVLTAKSLHRQPWAKTTVELLIEHAHQQRAKFCSQQTAAVDDCWKFVSQQRAARKAGGGAKEVNRDKTEFDRQREAWSKATVSHRGKVGGSGDHKQQSWLG